MTTDVTSSSVPERDGALPFFLLACGFTWVLALPAAMAWMRHEAPGAQAIACAGLSAFGPSLAALIVAGARGELAATFGRWRAPLPLVTLSLAAPFLVHLSATLLTFAVGGHPSRWLHPPSGPEALAALVVFPLGEEVGWRGFAHPRLVARFGRVRGSLLLGAVWGLWHLVYSVTPARAGFDVFAFVYGLVELPLYSLLIAWVFERGGRGLWTAVAFHAGAHLDHLEQAPSTELVLHGLHLMVLAVLAIVASRALGAMERESPRSALVPVRDTLGRGGRCVRSPDD